MQIKKWYILIIVAIIALSSCSVSRRASTRYQTLSQRVQVQLEWNQQRYSMNSTVRIWRGEIIIVSVQPMLGIEMLRVEATRDSVLVLDKMNRRYVTLAYSDIEQQTRLKINYKTLQDLLSKPVSKENKEHIALTLDTGNHQLKLSCQFINREYNTLQDATRAKISRYKQVDLRTILPL